MKKYIKAVADLMEGDILCIRGCYYGKLYRKNEDRWYWTWGHGFDYRVLASLLVSPEVECWREVKDKPKVRYVTARSHRDPRNHADIPRGWQYEAGERWNCKFWPAGEPEPLPEDVANYLRYDAFGTPPGTCAGALCEKYGIEP